MAFTLFTAAKITFYNLRLKCTLVKEMICVVSQGAIFTQIYQDSIAFCMILSHDTSPRVHDDINILLCNKSDVITLTLSHSYHGFTCFYRHCSYIAHTLLIHCSYITHTLLILLEHCGGEPEQADTGYYVSDG